MANTAKSDLLLLFFACLGLTADLRLLLQGGSRLIRFLVALAPFLLAQDALGLLMAKLLSLHPLLGRIAGSTSRVSQKARAVGLPITPSGTGPTCMSELREQKDQVPRSC
jgi:sodium--glutamate symport carrier gltS